MRRILASIAAGIIAIMGICLLGMYPPASAQQASPLRQEQLAPGCAGVKTCECCHAEVITDLEKTPMGRLFLRHPRNSEEKLVCETCHGPGKEHADTQGAEFGNMIRFAKGSPTPAEKRNEACLECHQRKNLLFWQGSAHQMRDLNCSDCHSVHKGSKNQANRKLLVGTNAMQTCERCHKQQVAQQMRFSRHPLREGKMDCTSCHNPHGTPTEDLLKANSTPDLCYSCHSQVRGPFLNEHPPVIEDCSNCHTSHGSTYPRLLKQPEIRLCRECHTNFHGLNLNGRRATPHVLGRACSDCHVNIHGSNHPTGQFFTR